MSSKKNKLLESAQKNIQKGHYDRAIGEYEEIIRLDPDDVRHKQRLAELLAKANRKDNAIKEYTALAKHYIESVHYLKAIAVYKQVQKLDPANPEISLTLASLNEKQGLIGNAAAEYSAALQIYENNGENRKALNVLESLLALDPGNSAIRLRIAEKYFTTGNEDKAFAEFETVAIALQENEDETGFRHVFDRLRTISPERAQTLYNSLTAPELPEAVEPEIPAPPEAVEPEAPVAPEAVEPEAPAPPAAVDTTDLATGEAMGVGPLQEETAPEAEEIEDLELELIEDLLPLEETVEPEEFAAEPEEAGHEWEEEIDLGAIVPEEAAATPLRDQEELPEETEDTLPELELEDLELELELEELELEIEPETAAEPATETAAAPEQPLETFDLAGDLSIFADEIDFDVLRTDGGGDTFAMDSLAAFKKGELDNEDTESHYSLGLAYKEMGLFDDAIAEFTVASHSPARRIDCLTLQGLCHRENGALDQAVEILTVTLQEPTITEDELLGIKYELAVCHDMAGDKDAARRLFSEIVTVRPGFSDAAARLEKL